MLVFTSARGALDAFERFVYALLAVFLNVREMDIRAFVPRGLVTDHVIRAGLFVAPDGRAPSLLSFSLTMPCSAKTRSSRCSVTPSRTASLMVTMVFPSWRSF